MKTWVAWLIAIVVFVLTITIIVVCKNITIKNKDTEIANLTEQIEYYKNAANPSKETIDSLVYNIEYRDTIIYNIKQKYITDVEIVKEMSDSSLVTYFKELVWSD